MSSPAVATLSKFFDNLFSVHRYRPYQYFGWMLDMLLDQLYQRTTQVPEDAQAEVEQALALYMKAVQKEAPLTDILGDLYMELSSKGQKQWMGQYFTPAPVADMMAMMTIGNSNGPHPDGRLWTTIDPACGSGAMMLAAARHILQEQGTEGLKYWSFSGVDLDPTCANMMAAQFMANACVHELTYGEILVLRGNSLLPANHWTTIIHASCPAIPVAPAKHPARVEAIQEAAKTAGLQLAFDFGEKAA